MMGISAQWNIDSTTCVCTLRRGAFWEGSVAATGLIFCNKKWRAHGCVKESSAGGAQWPAGHYHLWVKSWLRPVTLSLTARGNKKLCFHFKSAEFQLTHRSRFSGLKNYRIPPFPISPTLDQTVAGSWNNYPKGRRATLFIAHWAPTVPI